jgi:hypothetical protein
MKRVLRFVSALALAVGLSFLLTPAAKAGGCGMKCGGGYGWGRVVGFYPMPAVPGYVVSGCGGCTV